MGSGFRRGERGEDGVQPGTGLAGLECGRGFVDHDPHVSDSILFRGVRVGSCARLHRCIIDKNVNVPEWTRIGLEPEQDRELYATSDEGIVVLPKDYRFD